jgi:hypothetical protein
MSKQPVRRKNREQALTNPDDSCLHNEWIEPERPYSQKELDALETDFFEKIQLSTGLSALHNGCGHTYQVKKNGVKFKELLAEPEMRDVGNCSVCWKLSRTPRELKHLANDFIQLYKPETNIRKSFYDYQVKKTFYTWLYSENYR